MKLRPSALRALAPAALALLAACGSTPLPPWPSDRPTARTAPAVVNMGSAAAPAAAASAPGPASPAPAVVVEAVPPPGAASAAAPAEVAAGIAPAPYGPEVAARFPEPSTTYQTPGLESGRDQFSSNSEISGWLRDLAAASGGRSRIGLLGLGASQSGTPLEALVLTRAASTDPAALLASGKPTVLLVGQQHGDEPAPAEALLVLARELARGRLEPLLDRINVVLLPRANPDGAAAGKRVTAGGIDMNRDHLLLRTPEARALARLQRDYQPAVTVDAHEYTVVGRFLEKFGAIQKFDALVQYATTANLSEFMPRASEEWFRRPLVAALNREGLSNEWYYTTSTDPNDLRISMGGTQPDTGRNVFGLRNSVSLLLETRGVGIGRLHIQRRVHTQVVALTSVLQSASQRAEDLGKVRSYMDREAAGNACRGEVVTSAGPTLQRRALVMLDPATGADRSIDVDWNSALELRPLKARGRPCGYWLAAASTQAVERLQQLGVQVMRVAEPGAVLGESYRETARTSGERSDVRGAIADAAPIVQVEVALARGVLDTPMGSYYVPLSQPLANLVVAALEPDTQNSFFANRVVDALQSQARVVGEPTMRLEPLPAGGF
ncbi:M14 family metallopeptidase [Pseudorhodoferax soli]|uniref:Zinc carboxypeptidase n=1 Tax=Pseudorhodoferax soli TaxID=545864 RepID=A0A368Y115_9BURK|nr:M14 family metallopeptidase [Pseudorhodoferax soli]RCW72988.1 zinc carboxypeptidase [Pseudorhodoferax soli]